MERNRHETACNKFRSNNFCNLCLFVSGIYNDTVLTVYNAQRLHAPDGLGDDIEGYAATTEDPAKLVVGFGGKVCKRYVHLTQQTM